jgi:cytochrome P450
LFRHDDVVAVAENPGLYSSASSHRAIPNGMDPPEHATWRHVLEPYFDQQRIDAFGADCRRIASDAVKGIMQEGHVEFVGAFAHPFALKSLCAFLGWPEATWEQLHGWTHGNQEASLARNREEGARLAREFTGYVVQELNRRRAAEPAAPDDITTSLMRTRIDGQPLSDEDIVSILRNWTAGQGTVSGGIEILVWHLTQFPDVQKRLRENPELIGAAVDEVLRTDGPLVANRRTATNDVEIGGRQIPRDAKLTLMWIAADRDPDAFQKPYQIQLDRDQADNLLFGQGIHYCLGAPLARLEMRIALEELLSQTSTITFGPTSPRRAVYPSNGFHSLPIQVS